MDSEHVLIMIKGSVNDMFGEFSFTHIDYDNQQQKSANNLEKVTLRANKNNNLIQLLH